MWNGLVNGDWSTCDFTQPPFQNGVATLTHDEVVFVQETAAEFVSGYETDDFYVTSQYNIVVKYEKAINQDTYEVIKQYIPEVNTLGINESGIIKPVEETPTEEQPTEETAV
jgi:hypothetical protein